MSRDRERTVFLRRSRSARSARCLGPPTASAPSSPATSSGPSRPKRKRPVPPGSAMPETSYPPGGCSHRNRGGRRANLLAWRRRRRPCTGRLDLALSWSEQDLPERERTKHVHRLHPYLGKFVPQLVEALLDRYVPPGGRVLDPFAGSGTTLVQALEQGYDATGVDVASFNCLLMRVKTRRHNLDALRRDLLWAHEQAAAFEPARPRTGRGVPLRP